VGVVGSNPAVPIEIYRAVNQNYSLKIELTLLY